MSDTNSTAQTVSQQLIDMSLARLRKLYEDGWVQRQPVRRIKIEQPGLMTMPSEYCLDWSTARIHVQMELENGPVFKQFEQAVKDDPILGVRMNTMIGTARQRRLMTCRDFFYVLLSTAMSLCPEDMQLPKNRFNSVWDTVVGLLLVDSIDIRCWCIIENVDTPLGPTEVLPGVSLCGLSTSEIENMWDNNGLVQEYYPFGGLTTPPVESAKTVIETTIVEPVVVGSMEPDPSEALSRLGAVWHMFRAVVTSMRLLHTERVVMSPLFIQETDGIWRTTSAQGNWEGRTWPYCGRCRLLSQDLKKLQGLVNIVAGGEKELGSAAEMWLGRIDSANVRSTIEDRLLDIFMALESIVLQNSDSRSELTYRLSISLAKLLGTDPEHQRSIYNTIKTGYGLRSKVVHTGRRLEHKDLQAVDEVERLAKEAIVKRLRMLADKVPLEWEAVWFK